jgi:peptidoglycan biosynthesis protein MviN/MurJ (putative lipid II flippase)
VFANALLGVFLWFGSGSINEWVIQTVGWRVIHLCGLLLIGVMLYFAGLWLAGVRPRDLLIPPA